MQFGHGLLLEFGDIHGRDSESEALLARWKLSCYARKNPNRCRDVKTPPASAVLERTERPGGGNAVSGSGGIGGI
jgi:hypothetical protein